MTSLISSFYSRSTWHAAGICILPIFTDQLMQRVFSKKCSAYQLETAALVTSGVTYLLLSRELPPSFKIGAPILYLAYKAAQYYLSRQTPPDEGPPRFSSFPFMPYDLAPKPPVVSEASATSSALPPPPPAAPAEASATSSAPPAPPPAAPTAEDEAVRKKVEDRLNELEADHRATPKYKSIIKNFDNSELMILPVQVKANGVNTYSFEAKIRFGRTHVFKMRKTQVEELNKAGCVVTKKTVFFWIDITNKKTGEAASVNFLPLMMLDNLSPKAKAFSINILETSCELILQFQGNSLERLKAFAKTIQACRDVEIIRNGVLQLQSAEAKNSDAFISNDAARLNRSKCYLEPFIFRNLGSSAASDLEGQPSRNQ